MNAAKGKMFKLTCNCYCPMFREDVELCAPNLEVAVTKAIQKLARKHKATPDDIVITAIYRLDTPHD